MADMNVQGEGGEDLQKIQEDIQQLNRVLGEDATAGSSSEDEEFLSEDEEEEEDDGDANYVNQEFRTAGLTVRSVASRESSRTQDDCTLSEEEEEHSAPNNDNDAVDPDGEIAASPQHCLHLNGVYQFMINENLRTLKIMLEENRKKQEAINEELSGDGSKSGRLGKNNALGKHFNIFFKDETGSTPSANGETISRKQSGHTFAHRSLPRKWTASERSILHKAVCSDGKKQRLQPLMNKQEVLRRKFDKVPDSEIDDIQKAINDLQEQILQIGNMPETEFIGERWQGKKDWDKIACVDFNGERTAIECELVWQNRLHPSISTSPWSKEEDEKLAAAVEENEARNWNDIAESLGTGRSTWQCIQRYQQRLNPNLEKKKFTEEDDILLGEIIEKLRIGDRIPYTKVAYFLDGCTPNRVYNRWRHTVDPKLKRGKWSEEENELLRQAIDLYGENWKAVTPLIPGRISSQIRDRWLNALKPNVKRGPWEEAEDTKLMQLVVEHGIGNWSTIASKMGGGRRPNSILWRYRKLCGWFKKGNSAKKPTKKPAEKKQKVRKPRERKRERKPRKRERKPPPPKKPKKPKQSVAKPNKAGIKLNQNVVQTLADYSKVSVNELLKELVTEHKQVRAQVPLSKDGRPLLSKAEKLSTLRENSSIDNILTVLGLGGGASGTAVAPRRPVGRNASKELDKNIMGVMTQKSKKKKSSSQKGRPLKYPKVNSNTPAGAEKMSILGVLMRAMDIDVKLASSKIAPCAEDPVRTDNQAHLLPKTSVMQAGRATPGTIPHPRLAPAVPNRPLNVCQQNNPSVRHPYPQQMLPRIPVLRIPRGVPVTFLSPRLVPVVQPPAYNLQLRAPTSRFFMPLAARGSRPLVAPNVLPSVAPSTVIRHPTSTTAAGQIGTAIVSRATTTNTSTRPQSATASTSAAAPPILAVSTTLVAASPAVGSQSAPRNSFPVAVPSVGLKPVHPAPTPTAHNAPPVAAAPVAATKPAVQNPSLTTAATVATTSTGSQQTAYNLRNRRVPPSSPPKPQKEQLYSSKITVAELLEMKRNIGHAIRPPVGVPQGYVPVSAVVPQQSVPTPVGQVLQVHQGVARLPVFPNQQQAIFSHPSAPPVISAPAPSAPSTAPPENTPGAAATNWLPSPAGSVTVPPATATSTAVGTSQLSAPAPTTRPSSSTVGAAPLPASATSAAAPQISTTPTIRSLLQTTATPRATATQMQSPATAAAQPANQPAVPVYSLVVPQPQPSAASSVPSTTTSQSPRNPKVAPKNRQHFNLPTLPPSKATLQAFRVLKKHERQLAAKAKYVVDEIQKASGKSPSQEFFAGYCSQKQQSSSGQTDRTDTNKQTDFEVLKKLRQSNSYKLLQGRFASVFSWPVLLSDVNSHFSLASVRYRVEKSQSQEDQSERGDEEDAEQPIAKKRKTAGETSRGPTKQSQKSRANKGRLAGGRAVGCVEDMQVADGGETVATVTESQQSVPQEVQPGSTTSVAENTSERATTSKDPITAGQGPRDTAFSETQELCDGVVLTRETPAATTQAAVGESTVPTLARLCKDQCPAPEKTPEIGAERPVSVEGTTGDSNVSRIQDSVNNGRGRMNVHKTCSDSERSESPAQGQTQEGEKSPERNERPTRKRKCRENSENGIDEGQGEEQEIEAKQRKISKLDSDNSEENRESSQAIS